MLDAARSLGVDIDSVCGGRGICGRCQVTQGLGEFPKHGIVSEPDHLSAFAALETTYRDEKGLAADRRLSCTAQVCGDVLIDVPPESQVHRQVVRKGLDVRDLHRRSGRPAPLRRGHAARARVADRRPRPAVRGARARVAADRSRGGPRRSSAPSSRRSRSGKYGVTVAVHEAHQVIAVWPGLHETAYGVAIDIGSTTIAGHLANLADGAVLASNGVMNPQIRFGEDLMSRVSYAMMHPEGAGEMTAAVRKALDGLIASLAMRAGIKRVEILELALVGNPIMHHLLLGIDPTPLGGAPFALATDRAVRTTAAELGLRAHPGARVYVLPCIAGHVGADTAGVILAEQPHQAERMTLVVDVGTNAEIVLGDKRRLLAASSPTGPAFEGAQISRRPARGARRHRARPDRPRDARAALPGHRRRRLVGRAGLRDRRRRDRASPASAARGSSRSSPSCSWPGIVTEDGVIDGALAARTPRIVPDGRTFSYVLHEGDGSGAGPRIAITQNDVRAIQLAKAALYAGVRLLMDQLEIDAVDEIRLAGAFGSQIDPTHAMILGLIPDCDLAHVRSAGNAAGTGALIALLSGAARTEIEGVVRRVEKIETAVEPRFQEHFVEAMAFPHKTADFPHLAAVVPLPAAARPRPAPPEPTPATSGDAGGPWRSARGRTADGRPAAAAKRRPRRPPGAPAGQPTPSTSRS